jgi:hypothetical protein
MSPTDPPNQDDTEKESSQSQQEEFQPLFKNVRAPKTLKYKDPATGKDRVANSRPPKLKVNEDLFKAGDTKVSGTIYTNTATVIEASTTARTEFNKALPQVAPPQPASGPPPPQPLIFTPNQLSDINAAVYKQTPVVTPPTPPTDAGTPHKPEFSAQLERARDDLKKLANSKTVSTLDAHERAIKIKDRLLTQVDHIHQRQQKDLTELLNDPTKAFSENHKKAANDALTKAQNAEKAAVEKYANDAVVEFHRRVEKEQFQANLLRLAELDPNFAKRIQDEVTPTDTKLFGVGQKGEELTSDLSAKLGSPEQFPAYKHKDYNDITVSRLGGNALSVSMRPWPKDPKKLKAAAELAIRAAINEGFPGIKVSGTGDLAKAIWLEAKLMNYRVTFESGETPEMLKMLTQERARRGITEQSAVTTATQEQPGLATDIANGKITIPLHIANQDLRQVTTSTLVAERARGDLELRSGLITTNPKRFATSGSTPKEQLSTIAKSQSEDKLLVDQLDLMAEDMKALNQALDDRLARKDAWLQDNVPISVHRAPGNTAYKVDKNAAVYAKQVEEMAKKTVGKPVDTPLSELDISQQNFASKAYRTTQLELINEEIAVLKQMQASVGQQAGPRGTPPPTSSTVAALKANNVERMAALKAIAEDLGQAPQGASTNNARITIEEVQALAEDCGNTTVSPQRLAELKEHSDRDPSVKSKFDEYVKQYKEIKALDEKLDSIDTKLRTVAANDSRLDDLHKDAKVSQQTVRPG